MMRIEAEADVVDEVVKNAEEKKKAKEEKVKDQAEVPARAGSASSATVQTRADQSTHEKSGLRGFVETHIGEIILAALGIIVLNIFLCLNGKVVCYSGWIDFSISSIIPGVLAAVLVILGFFYKALSTSTMIFILFIIAGIFFVWNLIMPIKYNRFLGGWSVLIIPIIYLGRIIISTISVLFIVGVLFKKNEENRSGALDFMVNLLFGITVAVLVEGSKHNKLLSEELGEDQAKYRSVSPTQSMDILTAQTILGVDSNASMVDIKKAYQNRALKYHPDRYSTADEKMKQEANFRMSVINNAHEVLLAG